MHQHCCKVSFWKNVSGQVLIKPRSFFFFNPGFDQTSRSQDRKRAWASYSWTPGARGRSWADRPPGCDEAWLARSGSRSAPCCTRTFALLGSKTEEEEREKIVPVCQEAEADVAATHLRPGRRRRRRWCHHRARNNPGGGGGRPAPSCPPSSGPAAGWSEPWAPGSSPACGGGGWGSTQLCGGSSPAGAKRGGDFFFLG